MIEVKNIQMKFKNKVVFNDFNYIFQDNNIYVITGTSGIGKTTLLRIISGLQKPDNGKILFNSQEIIKPADKIFMMHQRYTNFPWMTCLDNILIPIKIKNNITKGHIIKAQELLIKVGLKDYINKYPYELSGGMQQRLALARTLMTEPPVILMDEPLSALDPYTRSEMQNLVLDLHYRTKNLIIMITHDMDEAKKMNDVIINL